MMHCLLFTLPSFCVQTSVIRRMTSGCVWNLMKAAADIQQKSMVLLPIQTVVNNVSQYVQN